MPFSSKEYLESLLKASKILHSSLDIEYVLKEIIELVTEIVGGEAGSIYLLDEETNELVIRMSKGPLGDKLKGLRIKIPEGICGNVAKTGDALLIEDVSKDTRWNPRPTKDTAFVTKTIMAAPMLTRGKVNGVLQVINKSSGQGHFTAAELEVMQGFANIAAAAIENAREYRTVAQENKVLKQKLSGQYELIGNSPPFRRVMQMVEKIATTDTFVLIEGESGTGKELLARAIHKLSHRRDGPFVPLNCGALTETLLESELFGHEKGSFTGANHQRKGLFEEAIGGTIFLDEIGETSAATQVKLLRVLQEGRVKRVGSNLELDTDVRVITATNKNLQEMVGRGLFREDLFYRLNVVNLRLPSLRERLDDLPALALYFLEKYSRKFKRQVETIDQAVMQRFYTHAWKGNIRELENVIESSVAVCEGKSLREEDLPGHFSQKATGAAPGFLAAGRTYSQAKEQFEELYFSALLQECGGDVKEAAQRAQVSEKSVVRRRSRFELGKE